MYPSKVRYCPTEHEEVPYLDLRDKSEVSGLDGLGLHRREKKDLVGIPGDLPLLPVRVGQVHTVHPLQF